MLFDILSETLNLNSLIFLWKISLFDNSCFASLSLACYPSKPTVLLYSFFLFLLVSVSLFPHSFFFI